MQILRTPLVYIGFFCIFQLGMDRSMVDIFTGSWEDPQTEAATAMEEEERAIHSEHDHGTKNYTELPRSPTVIANPETTTPQEATESSQEEPEVKSQQEEAEPEPQPQPEENTETQQQAADEGAAPTERQSRAQQRKAWKKLKAEKKKEKIAAAANATKWEVGQVQESSAGEDTTPEPNEEVAQETAEEESTEAPPAAENEAVEDAPPAEADAQPAPEAETTTEESNSGWSDSEAATETPTPPAQPHAMQTKKGNFQPKTSPPLQFYKPTGPETYFYLHSANEGMSNWKRSLAQLIGVAKTLNVSIVEPCVARGMLRSCNASDVGIMTDGTLRPKLPKGMVPLREVYDMQTFLDYYPKWVTYEDFLEHTNYHPDMENLDKVCMSRWMKSKEHICNLYEIRNAMMGMGIKEMDKAITKTRDEQQTTIIEIYDLWRWGIGKYRYGCSTKGKRCPLPESMQQDWKKLEYSIGFPQHQIDNVFGMLQVLLPNTNISADVNGGNLNFGAIQWRPETKEIPYGGCARAIVDTRDRLAEEYGIPKENFILISPLSENSDLVWDGVNDDNSKHATKVHDAFQVVRGAGIQRLEDAHTAQDGSLPAVWDFLASTLATGYSTCAKGCNSYYCKRCNYLGNTATFTIKNRNRYRSKVEGMKYEDTTHKCWPQKGLSKAYGNGF